MLESSTAAAPPSPLRPNLAADWMLDPSLTFLNHGSFGSVPRVVFEEQTRLRQWIESDPIEILGRRCIELLDRAKQPVGRLLGMQPADFGFVTNATEGMNAVLQSFPLQAGDELLTTNHVYNAVRQAMRHVAARAGATVCEVPIPLPLASDEPVVQAIADAIRPRTRLLVIDHITSPTALIFPVERLVQLCRQRGVAVLIDGAHAPGMIDLNVERIGADFYAGNLHKWLCAPKGSGFLWVGPQQRDRIHPLVVSHYLGEGFAREFSWQGTRDISAWLSVPKAIEYLEGLGLDSVRRHNHELAVWVQTMLCRAWGVEPASPLDGSLLGSMATVLLPRPPSQPDAAIQQILHDRFRIEVPLVDWSGRHWVRPCCQVYNSPDQYQRLAEVIVGTSSISN